MAHLESEAHAIGQVLAALECDSLEPGGGSCGFLLAHQVGADRGMGAHEGAAVALDTGVGLPHGRRDGNAALLESGETHVDDAVLVARKRTHGELIAFLGVHGAQDVRDHSWQSLIAIKLVELGVCPARRDRDLHTPLSALLDGGHVARHHGVALARVGLPYRVLHIVESLLDRHEP